LKGKRSSPHTIEIGLNDYRPAVNIREPRVSMGIVNVSERVWETKGLQGSLKLPQGHVHEFACRGLTLTTIVRKYTEICDHPFSFISFGLTPGVGRHS
jgi:hypothetical protein